MKQIGPLLRLEYGEELHTRLDAYARSKKLAGAWLDGLGGTTKVTLGFYDLPSKQYRWKTFDMPLEIISLAGNLAVVDGEPVWHLHGTFSGPDYQAIGGHVKELVVGPTCELRITPIEQRLTRAYDEKIGLKLLSPAE